MTNTLEAEVETKAPIKQVRKLRYGANETEQSIGFGEWAEVNGYDPKTRTYANK